MTTKYISLNPEILGGAPALAGTRIPMARIIFLLKEGYTVANLAEEYRIDEKRIEEAVNELVDFLSTAEDAKKVLKIQASLG